MATTMATTAVTAATAAAAATRFNLRGVCLRSSATPAKASLGNSAYGRSYSSGVGNVGITVVLAYMQVSQVVAAAAATALVMAVILAQHWLLTTSRRLIRW